ncbi:hypothetical protein NUW54_g1859 [Trametes sanguinea]|uniref:Uncharacterized protein n=1 Tax=Trametes sanguinea TaxID=158606 RepID=A0ACC1Q5R9_9APHY|nr:hypothetical protein NUW54_g1859 [Trametes sanguinea]
MEPPAENAAATERIDRSYILLLKPPSSPGSVVERMAWDISRGRAMPYQYAGDSSGEANPASASHSPLPHPSIIGVSEGEEEATEDESSTLVAAEDDGEETDPPSTLEDSDGELPTKKDIIGRLRSSTRKPQLSQYASNLRDADGRYSSANIRHQGYTAAMNIDVNDGQNRGRQGDKPEDDKPRSGKAAKSSKVKAMFRRIKSVFQGASNVSDSQQTSPSSAQRTRGVFDLLVDTGSSTSWVIGSETKKIERKHDGKGKAILKDWDDSDLRRDPTHTVLPISALKRVDERDCTTGHVEYGDHGEARLVLSRREELEIDFLCVDWVLRASGRLAVYADLGIAWALSPSLHRDPADGMLGLGRLEIQPDFDIGDDEYEPPTFMTSLKQRLPKLDAVRIPFHIPPHTAPVDRSMNVTTALGRVHHVVRDSSPLSFSALNVPSAKLTTIMPRPVEESWLAYQKWPCLASPRFSPPLAMDPAYPDEWMVQLIRMTFHGFAGGRPGFASEYVIDMAKCSSNTGSGTQSSSEVQVALPVLLDTVLNIRKHVIGDIPQNQDLLTSTDLRYSTVPPEFPNSGVTVVYDFIGVDGEVVSVTGSCRPFLTGLQPCEEGRCSSVPGSAAEISRFRGHLWACMHKGVHGDDYVTLAPQRLSEMSRYTMPSLDEA